MNGSIERKNDSMSLLCKIGIHKWSKSLIQHNFASHVVDYQQHCLRCGKIKRWNRPV